MAEVVARWPEAVGPQIARNAWPARLGRDGTLHVAAGSSAWAFELTNLRPVVLDRLRAVLGADAPTRLAFAPGKLPEVGPEAADPAPGRRLEPGAAEVARAGELTAAISSEPLRERVAGALAAALARGADDRPF